MYPYYDFTEIGCVPLIAAIVLVAVLVFGLVKCERAEFRENWANKLVIVNALGEQGIVVGGGSSREQGRMLNIKLKNGKEIYISAKQVTVAPEQKSDKDVQIEKIQSEINARQAELQKLKEAK